MIWLSEQWLTILYMSILKIFQKPVRRFISENVTKMLRCKSRRGSGRLVETRLDTAQAPWRPCEECLRSESLQPVHGHVRRPARLVEDLQLQLISMLKYRALQHIPRCWIQCPYPRGCTNVKMSNFLKLNYFRWYMKRYLGI